MGAIFSHIHLYINSITLSGIDYIILSVLGLSQISSRIRSNGRPLRNFGLWQDSPKVQKTHLKEAFLRVKIIAIAIIIVLILIYCPIVPYSTL